TWASLPTSRREELTHVLGRMMSRYLEGGGADDRDDDSDAGRQDGQVARHRDGDLAEFGEDRDAASRSTGRGLHPPVVNDAGPPKPGIDEAAIQPRSPRTADGMVP